MTTRCGCRYALKRVAWSTNARKFANGDVSIESGDVCYIRASDCVLFGRGLELLGRWRAAFPGSQIIVGSYARWLAMRREQQYVVWSCLQMCALHSTGIRSNQRRFHSSEFLDALSVLPKDAEQQRKQAKRAAKQAERAAKQAD